MVTEADLDFGCREEMTIDELLNEVKIVISDCEHNLEEFTPCDIRREAEILICEALGISQVQLFISGSRICTEEQVRKALSWASRRAEGEPWAYICGRKEFYGLEFVTGPGVLIPRPDTEALADCALAHLDFLKKQGRGAQVLDLCTGSGCVALTLKKEAPWIKISASDISSEAAEYFYANCRNLNIPCFKAVRSQSEASADGIAFYLSDLFAEISGKFDLITANPPYIGSNGGDGQVLQQSVACWEPSLALFAGEDGLDIIRRLVKDSCLYLNPGGRLAFEIGCGQGSACLKLMEEAGFKNCGIIQDLGGLDRVCTGVLP